MSKKKVDSQQVVEVYLECANVTETARRLGVHRKTIQYHLRKNGIEAPLATGNVKSMSSEQLSLPKKGNVKRYILTCAQNNTHLNLPFWKNLLTLAKYYDAEILVSRFTYNKNAYGKLSVKPDTEEHQNGQWYSPELNKYISEMHF